MGDIDPYNVLGVGRNASLSEIKKVSQSVDNISRCGF